MDHPPSFSVCFSLEDIHRDDHSELTGSCYDDYVYGLSQEDDFGIERAADPCHRRASDGASRDGTEELSEARTRLVRKQEEVDRLSSRLSQCEVDIEALRAERSALVNELAEPPQERCSKAGDDGGGGGGSTGDANARLAAENARLRVAVDIMRKAFQSYVEDSRRTKAEDGKTIGELKQENELLWQHIDLSSTGDPATPAIPSDPERERAPRARPSDSSDFTKLGPAFKGKHATLSGSERTARTCPLDASDVTLPQLGVPLSSLRSMALSESESESDSESERTETHPAPGSNESKEEVEDDLPSGRAPPLNRERSELIRVLRVPGGRPEDERPAAETEGEDGGSTSASDAGACLREESGEMVVDFGETRRTKTAARRRNSLPDGAARGGLLVDFGETRRPKRTAVRWHSFHW